MLVFFGGPGPKFSLEGVDLPDEIYLVSYSGSLPKLHLDYMLGSATAYPGILCIETRFQE